MAQLIIQNGTVVTPNGSFRAEIAVKDGKIWAIGAKGRCRKRRKKSMRQGFISCRV